MKFDIDVSGEDLLSNNFTIGIANNDSLIKGYKFNSEIVSTINSRYGQGFYRYSKSNKGRANLKVRIYCVVLYYLFESIQNKVNNNRISLNICRDFAGKENEIKNNIEHFLINKLNLNLNSEDIFFTKLPATSHAHQYSHLMKKDLQNKFSGYVDICLEDIEKYLKK